MGRSLAGDPLEVDLERPAAQVGDRALVITPDGWFAAQSSDVGGQAIRQSFNDPAPISNPGFQTRVLARWRRVLFCADWTCSDIETDLGTGSASTCLWDAEFRVLFFRVTRRGMISAGYRLCRFDRTHGEGLDGVEQTISVVGPAFGLRYGIF